MEECLDTTGPAFDEGRKIMGLLLRRLPDSAGQLAEGDDNVATAMDDWDVSGAPLGADLLPPYASYSSWVRLLDALVASVPGSLDEPYLASSGFSDSSIKPLRSALRFLGLVGRDDRPTDRLQKLVDSLRAGGDVRIEALRQMIMHAYGPLFSPEFDLRSATTEQLRAYFGGIGAQGQIQQKCSSFFLNLARDAGLELPSQLISRAPMALGRSRSARSSKMAGVEAGSTGLDRRQWSSPASREASLLRDVFPSFDIDWPEDKKQRWFKDFARLIKIYETEGEQQSA